jgi:UDP-N-acetylmuramoyl-tripeptide--D-alanyl-D-alanine ligase
MAGEVSRQAFFFGHKPEAAVSSHDMRATGRSVSFTLKLPGEAVRVRLNTPARFMVTNALAAASVGVVLGLTGGEIRDGLEDFVPVRGRLNIFETADGIVVIDDTYNANPGSMKAALKTLMALPGSGRSVFVAGDMKELGAGERALHRQIGEFAARCGVDRIYACGQFSEELIAGARTAGMAPAAVTVADQREIVIRLNIWLQPGDRVLVKGSRAMAMEQVTEQLRRRGGSNRPQKA